MNKIYLDYAAATPTDDKVVEVMKPFFKERFYNPSAVYLSSRDTKQQYDEIRADVAHWLGARPSEITFCAGATEANNLAIQGVMKRFPDARILTSSIEHDSVIAPANQYSHEELPVNSQGHVEAPELKANLSDDVVLVSIIYANNEIGTVQSMKEISAVIEAARENRRQAGNKLPLLFHTDASQAINYLDIHVNKLGVDLMTLSGSKIYGPKQSGALYIRGGVVLEPVIYGGGQEHGLRSGTENLAQVVGFAKALSMAQKNRKDEQFRLSNLRRVFIKKIEELDDEINVLGAKKNHLPNIVAIQIDKLDGERAVMSMDEKGIECATGSACSALSDEASHVIKAIGYTDEQASGTIRFSMGRFTTEEDIVAATTALSETLSQKNNWK